MYSQIKILGHPVHPMLVSFPIAFYTGTFIAFIVYAFTNNPFVFRLAIVANAAGVATALLAAIPGFYDWFFGIPKGSRAKTHGVQHMILNVTALVLFAITLGLNGSEWRAMQPDTRFAIILPLLGILCTIGAGYLGWTLVQTDHVGMQFSPEEEQCLRSHPARR